MDLYTFQFLLVMVSSKLTERKWSKFEMCKDFYDYCRTSHIVALDWHPVVKKKLQKIEKIANQEVCINFRDAIIRCVLYQI